MIRIAAALAVLALPSLAFAKSEGGVMVFGAQKEMDEDWKPAHQQLEVGGEIFAGEQGKPIAFVAGGLNSRGSGEAFDLKLTVETTELYAGVRLLAPGGSAIPYIEGGIVGAQVVVKTEVGSFRGDGVGGFAAGGVLLRVPSSPVVFGGRVRWSTADVEFESGGKKVDVGGLHYGINLGIAWPLPKQKVVRVGAAVEPPPVVKPSTERVILKTPAGSRGVAYGERVVVVRLDGTVARGRVIAVDAEGLTLKGLLVKPKVFTLDQIADIRGQ